MEKIRLNNNVEIPLLGLGTYQITGRNVQPIIDYALEVGYRHIDTAQAYNNEKEIGEALQNSSVSREEIFLTSKLDNSNHGYDKAIAAFEESLENLKTDYLDLFLIHWPSSNKRIETWKAFETLFDKGLCKAIGVSNYIPKHLDEILQNLSVKPAINQIEFNPFVFQKDILAYCKQHDIQLEAYTPIARAQKFKDERITNISKKYDKTPAQILLRWNIQHNAVVIPKSGNKNRIKENSNIFDFQISEDDMKILNSMNEDLRFSPNPHNIS